MVLIIVIIAVAGLITAVHSWRRITAEQKEITDAESKLISEEAWNDAYPHDKLQLATWLRHNGIKPDSHLGDFIRTCWSAWLGGRPASLTELHVLVARRERSYTATRVSAGIAALLLVCGIVGTLLEVKPVLEEFQLQVAEEAGIQPIADSRETDAASGTADDRGAEEPDRDAALVVENARKVNMLIQHLGGAFHPSLWALFGTIVVVSFRGLYLLSLHKFTLELDRFAVDTLIPRYRVPSLSEQYQEVKATLINVTETMSQREGRFLGAVEQLEKLVTGISPALSGLEAAAASAKEATGALASGATSISEALNRHLGAKSPIHRAVKGLDLVFEKTEKSLENLSSVVEGISESNTASQENLGSAIQSLGQSIERIGMDHESRQSEAAKALKDFKESLANIPAAIQATGEEAVEAGLTAVKTSIQELNGEQKKWHAATAEEFKAATTASLTGVTEAGQDLATQAGRVVTAASNIQGIKTDIGVALKELTDSGKSEISQIGEATKSKVESAAAKLSVETEKIRKSIELMGKPESEASPHRGPSKPVVNERLELTTSNLADNGEAIAGEAPPPTTTVVPMTPGPAAVMEPAPVDARRTEKATTGNTEPLEDPPAPHPAGRPTPLPAVHPIDTLVPKTTVAEPQPEKKRKWWDRIPNPFSGKNS